MSSRHEIVPSGRIAATPSARQTNALANAGRSVMNEVVLTPLAPVSAVPVLPATDTPEIWAAVPVPDSTTSCIIWVSCAAVSGETARESSCGCVREIVEPRSPGATTFSTTYGLMTTPPFAIPAATIAIWIGVTCIRSCPKASRPGSTWFGSCGRKRRPWS